MMIDKIEEIENPSFLKELSISDLKELAEKIRFFLIENISKTGGHLASNLGVIEITIALHKVFDSPNDKILFDVGHQAYTHKILTGRAKDFKTLRQIDGLSGYPSRKESIHDIFESGHSSNTLSAMAGMLLSQKESEKDNRIISVIGDASIANGMAFEALMNMGGTKNIAPIIILNDNQMAISKSVGSLEKALSKLRLSRKFDKFKGSIYKITPKVLMPSFHKLKRGVKAAIQRDNIFEDLGFDYYGPYDGNDIEIVIKTLERVKVQNKPLIVHFQTKKGKGYYFAENDETGEYHGVSPFDIETGNSFNSSIISWSEVISRSLIEICKEDPFHVITPAMVFGSKLDQFKVQFPSLLHDCGIAEEHAATMASGMALSNTKVFLTMYSTFAQRAYDQILNDICRPNLNVVIGIDRAGVVGDDGQTHQGIFDLSMFNGMPNTTICMPSNAYDAYNLLRAGFKNKGPFIIRYPRGSAIYDVLNTNKYDIAKKYRTVIQGSKGYVISYGPDVNRIKKLILEHNLDVSLIEAIYIKPIDEEFLKEIASPSCNILIYEQVVKSGSLAESIACFMMENNLRYRNFVSMNIKNMIFEHGSIKDVLERNGLGDDDILRKIEEMICD